jgi:histidine triad (HIT) family protein
MRDPAARWVWFVLLPKIGYIGDMSPSEAVCPFCEITTGDREADVVFRGPYVAAFLDRRPLFPGHTLVVPAAHIQTLGELPHELMIPLMSAVKAVSRAMESGLRAEGSFVAVNNRVSQSVAHLHVHVVPRTKGDGLRGFFWPRVPYTDDAERERVAMALRESIAREFDSEIST